MIGQDSLLFFHHDQYNMYRCTPGYSNLTSSIVLYTWYTDECIHDNISSRLIKSTDDTTLVDISDSDVEYFAAVQWCKENFLALNVHTQKNKQTNKTKQKPKRDANRF